MKHAAGYARSTGWIWLVLSLVACATPHPATPTPVPQRFPTPIGQSTSTRVSASPVPATVRPSATPTLVATKVSTPTAHQFDDIDSRALVAALFPDLTLTQNGDEFIVNNNPEWTMWINSRAEGQFTQETVPELAAIVANEAPNLPTADLQKSAPWGSFLAIFQKRDGKAQVVQRGFLFPTEMSPLGFDVRIDRVVDFDRDNIDELLITTAATRRGVTALAAFLYLWNAPAFTEIWSAPTGDDNTAAINQAEYFASTSAIQFADVDGDGLDEIVVDTTRIDYARDSQGLANTDKETARRAERRVFRWDGNAYVVLAARATPMPPLPSPTP
jgi:hypothetical protein